MRFLFKIIFTPIFLFNLPNFVLIPYTYYQHYHLSRVATSDTRHAYQTRTLPFPRSRPRPLHYLTQTPAMDLLKPMPSRSVPVALEA